MVETPPYHTGDWVVLDTPPGGTVYVAGGGRHLWLPALDPLSAQFPDSPSAWPSPGKIAPTQATAAGGGISGVRTGGSDPVGSPLRAPPREDVLGDTRLGYGDARCSERERQARLQLLEQNDMFFGLQTERIKGRGSCVTRRVSCLGHSG